MISGPPPNTIVSLLQQAEGELLAITDIEGSGLTYAELRSLTDATHKFLAGRGFRKGDVIATSLWNSPETAALFIALITYCRVAPLNPAYTADEVTFALDDIGAAALVVSPEQVDAARAAEQLGLGVIRLRTGAVPVPGSYKLETDLPELSSTGRDNALEPEEIALLLHTSGTTSRPKLVPLTHHNLWLSSSAVARVLQLAPGDRCLSVMPFFHIHGLVAGILASLRAGACVLCPPGFQATSFLSWLHCSQATWYTAVPTMHQAILARAQRHRDALTHHKLRVIRSSSSPLYAGVWEQLEAVFGVPVLNSYGMTEAGHQISSVRLAGSSGSRTTVGFSSGPEVVIMDSLGHILPPGETGEVVLRGEQITSGYLKPLEANALAFHDGWFRTGDEGVISGAAELTLMGRIKEMINSGGEKISPYEVEEALLAHPAVAQAVAFAAPHGMLGEQVIAAVVFREGLSVPERELLNSAGDRLTRCKLPRRILFVDEIPRGATGKLQRIGLANRLGLAAHAG